MQIGNPVNLPPMQLPEVKSGEAPKVNQQQMLHKESLQETMDKWMQTLDGNKAPPAPRAETTSTSQATGSNPGDAILRGIVR